MIKVHGNTGHFCDGITRRSFVQAGALGVGGLLLPDFLRMREAQAGELVDERRRKEETAVILVWLSGGPGPMETWDPKPDAAPEIRGPLGSIPTKVDGIRFGELLPEQAKVADKVAIVRSVNHGTGDHTKGNHWMLTGWEGPNFNDATLPQFNPSMGAATSRLRGANRPGMPPYAAVPHLRGGTDNFFHYHAYLGSQYDPFITNSDPNDPKYAVRDLKLPGGLTLERLDDRKRLLSTLDRFRMENETGIEKRDGSYQRAFDLLTSTDIRSAFDISAEPDSVRDRYGRHTFGQSALLARRLVEAGVTFVTVNCVPWDHHGTADRYRTEEGARLLIPPLDKALAALIDDLVQRGLFDRVLVVAMGEFGRTPKMNEAGGRDHWGDVFSVLFANGRMKMGQAVGASSARGEYPSERPTSPQDVLSTVYWHLGIDPHAALFENRTGRPVALLDGGEPIKELIG
jgi:hypothetical protein